MRIKVFVFVIIIRKNLMVTCFMVKIMFLRLKSL